jgi:hypothetical protein
MSQEIKWIKIGENEFQIGETKISILENSIIYIDAIGDQSAEYAQILREHYKEVFARIPGKAHQLVNLNQGGKSSPEAREVYKEINEYENCDKVAVFGMHPVARVLASFVMAITNKSDVKFFSTKDEAIAWLRQD